MVREDGSIIIGTKVNTLGIKKGMTDIKNNVNNISGPQIRNALNRVSNSIKRIGIGIAGAFAVKGITAFGKECLELGSDLAEVQNVVDVVFPSMSAHVDKFSKSAAMNFGLSETMAKRYTGTFGAMAKAFGFTEKQAYDMGSALTGLSGDVASFYNISQDMAHTKLKSVFTGETESLKELGIVMTQSALDQYAMAKGFGKTTAAMTEQEKVVLRYKFVVSQLSSAQGDFARTSNSWANQIRILSLQFDGLKATLGQGFINLFTPAVRGINMVLAKLGTLANAFKSFTELITGNKSQASGNTGLSNSGLGAAGEEYNTAADGAENLAGAIGDTADATKKAEKAAKKYLSPLDEINKLSQEYDPPDYSGTGGNPPSGGSSMDDGPASGIEEVDYGKLAEGEDAISRFEELLKSKDWEGLGAYIASGINAGLQKVYDVISWDSVGPKITPFIDAFTHTFNSLVDNIDWYLMGRTAGAGFNTFINTLNMLIERINWKNLGIKFANGIEGFVDEVNWGNMGIFLGNKFMITWNIFQGFVENLPYAKIGFSIANTLNGAVSTISFGGIGHTLATGMNGAFRILLNFTRRFNWKELVDNIADGVNRFLREFNWTENGKALDEFIGDLLTALLLFAETTDWEAFGKGVADFLKEVDWKGHLGTVIDIIKEILGGLFDGLEESGTAGSIAAFLGKAFLAVKVADITGIGGLITKLLWHLIRGIKDKKNVSSMADAFKKLLGDGSKEAADGLGGLDDAAERAASGGIGSFVKSLGPLVGEAGLIALITAGTITLTKKFASFVETIQGGNGTLSNMGAAINDLSGKLQNFGLLTSAQADEISKIVDSCEDAEMSSQEMADVVMEKFAEWGISTQNVNSVLQDNTYWTTKTKEDIDLLAKSAGQLGGGMSKSAESINLSGTSVKEAMSGIRESLWNLSMTGGDFKGTYQGILMSLENTTAPAATAQEAMDMIIGQLEAAGVPTEEFIALMQKKFPQATAAVKKSVDKNIVEASQTIDKEAEAMKLSVEDSTSSIQSNTESSMSAADKSVTENMEDIKEQSEGKWTDSHEATIESLKIMKSESSKGMQQVYKNVESYMTSIYNIITNKFKWAGQKACQEIEAWKNGFSTSINIAADAFNGFDSLIENRMGDLYSVGLGAANQFVNGFSTIGSQIQSCINNTISKVNYAISNINWSISGIESAFNFGPWTIPTPYGYRTIGFNASFPRVNTIPYLAKGAVIPPNAPFAAVLGDQKHGTNIEAPLSTIEQAVRNVVGEGRTGSIKVPIYINGRQILEAVIDEAMLKRSRNGKNPFDL